VIGSYVEIGRGVVIGDNCKIETGAFIPPGIIIKNNVFIGPHTCFTNDKKPDLTNNKSFSITPTLVEDGAAIGANATIVCGVTIHKNALIGAGAVVTKDVPENKTVVGNPAKILK
jgi:acetyltransferase-like isoleucine patch superfamily enzyme